MLSDNLSFVLYLTIPVGKKSKERRACERRPQVTETSSAFPNTETFHRREEFCLLAKKLVRTCATKKALALGRINSLVDFVCFEFEMCAYYSMKFYCQLTNQSFLVSSNWTNDPVPPSGRPLSAPLRPPGRDRGPRSDHLLRRLLGPLLGPPQPAAAAHRGREEFIQLQGLPDLAQPQDTERPGMETIQCSSCELVKESNGLKTGTSMLCRYENQQLLCARGLPVTVMGRRCSW